MDKPLPWAIYCRLSLARFGDTSNVDDQERICRHLIGQRGGTIADQHVFKDNSRSAWQRNRKRPGWDQLLEAIERKEIAGVAVYHGDRLIRQPWDLELLLRLADEYSLTLASPTGSRNLDSPDDRYILRIEAASACRESDNTSRRLKRHHDRRAAEGLHRPGGRGGRAFGFQTDGITHEPGEAAIIRECAQRVLAGEEIGSLCRDLAARGVTSTAGNPMTHGTLKKTLIRPRTGGLFVHRGVVTGDAAWQPILDRETWEAVRYVLEQKADGFRYTTNSRRYLLTGIALCGTCGNPLAIRHNTRHESLRGYGCINPACEKKVHRSVKHLDPYVEGIVLAALRDPRLAEKLTGKAGAELRRKLEAAEGQRRQTLEEFGGEDPVSADVLRVSLRRIDERIASLKAAINASTTGHVLTGLIGISDEEWDVLPLERRRAAVKALVRVTVLATGQRGPGFLESSVHFVDLLVRTDQA